MMTVLPTPAPPKTPILPPFVNGQIRSMTLRPVSKTSTSVGLLLERGRGAVDRQVRLGVDRALAVDRVAEHVEDAAERRLADRHRDRARRCRRTVDAAREAVGRGHGHGAHPVVAEVLLDLADERILALALDLDGVVDGRQLAGRELDVDDGPVIWMTRPGRWAGAAVAMVSVCLLRPERQRALRAGRDLDHLAGDVRLADLVVGERQVLDELLGVLGRVPHRDHPARLLARLGLEDRLVEPGRDVARQQLLEDGRGARLEDELVAGDALGVLGRRDRQELVERSAAGPASTRTGCRRCRPGRTCRPGSRR